MPTPLFPTGKRKAVVLSYDDGSIHDRRLIDLLNHYGLKGTFHLNSGKLGAAGYVAREEVRTLYAGHEVSAHTVNHPGLTSLEPEQILREVIDDCHALSDLTGIAVRGMSYPFGDYDERVLALLRDTPITYARTVVDSHSFAIPTNFLAWHPTIHQFGRAGWDGMSAEQTREEIARFETFVTDFLTGDVGGLLYIWGHSWEFGDDEQRWEAFERLLKTAAAQSELCSCTHSELVDYLLTSPNPN